MTQDFIDEFTAALEKEGKLYVIAVFPKDMSSSFTSHNLDEAPVKEHTFPKGGTYSVEQSAVMAIQFSLGLEQGPAKPKEEQ